MPGPHIQFDEIQNGIYGFVETCFAGPKTKLYDGVCLARYVGDIAYLEMETGNECISGCDIMYSSHHVHREAVTSDA